MRILFLAPESSGVDPAPELQRLQAMGHNVYPMIGEVTLEGIYRLYEQGLLFGGIHILDPSLEVFAADGSPRRAIHLSKGDLLLPDKLAEMARNFQTKIVFLNTCISGWTGKILAEEGVPLTVFTTLPIRVKDAWYGALLFWRAIADMERKGNGVDLRKAVDALPSDGVYDFKFSEPEQVRLQLGPVLGRLDMVDHTMSLMTTQVESLTANQKNLTASIAAIERKLGERLLVRQFSFAEFIVAIIIVVTSVLAIGLALATVL